jgi:hypothetical protein
MSCQKNSPLLRVIINSYATYVNYVRTSPCIFKRLQITRFHEAVDRFIDRLPHDRAIFGMREGLFLDYF